MIIGASRGIGWETAKKFRAEGFQVAGTHRGSGVPDGVRGYEVDVRDRAMLRTAIADVAAAFGGLDVLVYNAGLAKQDLLIRLTDEDLQEVMEVNLIGAFTAVGAALLQMGKQRSGEILLVSSESSKTGIPGAASYTASKAGLEGLVKSAMWEAGPRGIKINLIAPGPTETDMLAQVSEDNRARLIEGSPLRRIAAPEEIAEAIFKLSSVPYMTGATIAVTGGEGLGF
jgi:beta-ketoacyl ACP reductase